MYMYANIHINIYIHTYIHINRYIIKRQIKFLYKKKLLIKVFLPRISINHLKDNLYFKLLFKVYLYIVIKNELHTFVLN